jgi:hypothetical protein
MAMDYFSMGMMAFSAFGELAGGQSKRNQADYTASVYDANASIARMQVQDTLERGRLLETQSRFAARKTIGAQRAALAAQGVDVNADSALDVQADTAGLGELDALTIRNNAVREAWGYQVESYNYGLRASVTRAAGESEQMSSILNAGMKAVQIYSATRKSK